MLALSIVWALLPLLSFGFLTPIVFIPAAVKLRSWMLSIATAVYTAALVIFVARALGDPDATINGWDLIPFVLMIGGTAHAFVIRHRFFTPRGTGAALPNQPATIAGTPNERAIAFAEHMRNQARELATKDPALARELRIGRPDLPRQYDDGGLVDANHAPAVVLVNVPGLTAETAKEIVRLREEGTSFISAEDVALAVNVPANLVPELAEYTIYLE